MKELLNKMGPVLALLFIVIIFGVADQIWGGGKFLQPRNLRIMLNTASLIAVPALGMTIIIIAGGIDLSAGTAMTLCATIFVIQLGVHAVDVEQNGELVKVVSTTGVLFALFWTLLTGSLCGLFNGTLISLSKVVPFIVTLGAMKIFLGAGQIFSGEVNISAPAHLPSWLAHFCYYGANKEKYLTGIPIPTSFVVAFVLAVFVWVLLKYTVFGRNVYAIGSSESTARLCGVNVPMMTIWIYMLAGIFIGMGALFYVANIKSANPTDGQGKELVIIAAVVLGGGSLNGGRGSVFGTLIGAMMIVMISSGCSQIGISNTYTHIIIGTIIIIAVIVDQLRNGSPEWLFRIFKTTNSESL